MKLNTPCVGICSTVYGDDICRGCKRIYTEIIAWNTYSEDDKQNVFNRLASHIVQIMQEKMEVFDVVCLVQQLQKHHIRYRDEQSPLCWAYHLLRVASDKIISVSEYGLVIKPAYQQYTPRQLFTLMDAELLQLAQSDYQKL